MLGIQEGFKITIVNAFGEAGEKWLETLEETVQFYLEKWNLKFLGPVSNLSYNYVCKVQTETGEPMILKVGVPNWDFSNEINTLRIYDGVGCAKLIKVAPEDGVMLLEALVPGTMLSEVQDEEQVLEHYMLVWKAIRRPISDVKDKATILDWATALPKYQEKHKSADGPLDMELVRAAGEFFKGLTETSTGLELLHGDLHHENILFSENRGWLAIDPKGVIGDPYFDLISFLFNHLFDKKDPEGTLKYRIESLVDGLGLNRERLLKAGVAMSVLSVCWSIEDLNPDWHSAYQCAKWIYDLL